MIDVRPAAIVMKTRIVHLEGIITAAVGALVPAPDLLTKTDITDLQIELIVDGVIEEMTNTETIATMAGEEKKVENLAAVPNEQEASLHHLN